MDQILDRLNSPQHNDRNRGPGGGGGSLLKITVLFTAVVIIFGLAISWWSGARWSPAGKPFPEPETLVLKKLPNRESGRLVAESPPGEMQPRDASGFPVQTEQPAGETHPSASTTTGPPAPPAIGIDEDAQGPPAGSATKSDANDSSGDSGNPEQAAESSSPAPDPADLIDYLLHKRKM
jgi:hypothetical protein